MWKDETGEFSALKASLKQVETQVKLDKVEAFTSSMGAFASGAAKNIEKLSGEHADAEEACKTLKGWFGEDAKTEPEDLFSTLHNFALTFQKAHKYNREQVLKEEKMARMAAAKAAGKAAPKPTGAPQRKNLVDNVDGSEVGKMLEQRRRRASQHPSASGPGQR